MPGEFWNNASVEPKRTHRFLIEFELPGDVSAQMYARSATKPGYEVGQSELKFLGQSYYYPGAVSWSDVTISLVNSANPDFDQRLQDLLYQAGYVNPSQVAVGDGVADGGTISKAASVAVLGRVTISEIDGDGLHLGHYVLNNAWIRSVAYSGLDYGSEELSTVDLTFRYDWATYSKDEGSLDGAVS
tara:strand:+ start:359 stop:919 length:561 start_codon:yes stop_codon:yes gene_type:complete